MFYFWNIAKQVAHSDGHDQYGTKLSDGIAAESHDEWEDGASEESHDEQA